jgi:biopolymer transport protein ExbD
VKLPHPTRRTTRISLTPLIDVVFLLLVFFMLASTFARLHYLPLDSSGPGAAATDAGQSVLVRVGAGGAVDINGEPVAASDLARRLDDFARRGTKRAIVRVQPGARTEDLVRVLEQARRSTLENLAVVR